MADAAIAMCTLQLQFVLTIHNRKFVLGHVNLNSANAAIGKHDNSNLANVANRTRQLQFVILRPRIDDRLINQHASFPLVGTRLL